MSVGKISTSGGCGWMGSAVMMEFNEIQIIQILAKGRCESLVELLKVKHFACNSFAIGFTFGALNKYESPTASF